MLKKMKMILHYARPIAKKPIPKNAKYFFSDNK